MRTLPFALGEGGRPGTAAFDKESLELQLNSRMVMTAGDDSDEVHYVNDPGDAKSVTVAQARSVEVPRMSQGIASCVVSNGTEQLVVSETHNAIDTYKVMLYDDVFVHFVVEPGMRIESENPFAIYGITSDVLVEPEVVAPLMPGEPFFCDTAAAATNVAKMAFLEPSAEVSAVLDRAGDGAHDAYRLMFRFVVRPSGDGRYMVVAELTPPAWTNVVGSAQAATRQIPVADIAALPLGVETNLMMKGCFVPGFFYTLYGAEGVRVLMEGTPYGPGLSDAEGNVTFPAVKKPSEEAGFFTIDVSATKGE